MTYADENNKILETFFNDLFFKRYKDDGTHRGIELFLTSDCDMKCDYCYIAQYGDKLYPKEIRHPDMIKANLRIFMDWVIEKNYFIHTVDIFSGEVFSSKLGFDCMNILLEYAQSHKYCKRIVIPTNCSFIKSEEDTAEVERLICEFDKVGVEFYLSCSVDGAPIDNISRITRASDAWRTEEYYDKLFKFIVKHRFGFHPMVGRLFVENYEKVYPWWIDKVIEYNHLHPVSSTVWLPMFLEVRNDDWDEELLEKYSNMLKFIIDYDLKVVHKGNMKDLAYRLFKASGHDDYNPNDICRVPLKSERISCSIQYGPAIRMGDLSLIPCHRTAYPQFIYGKFKVEDNKITGMQANNIQLATKIYSMNPSQSHTMCSDCLIKDICLRGCLGSQFESSGEIFAPINSVCNLMYTKFATLHKIFKEYGIYKILYEASDISSKNKSYLKRIEDILCQI